jgi:hypothetical protein
MNEKTNINYTDYLAEQLNSIDYAEYIMDNVEKSMQYSEYLANQINSTINYSDYLAECLETKENKYKKLRKNRKEKIKDLFLSEL